VVTLASQPPQEQPKPQITEDRPPSPPAEQERQDSLDLDAIRGLWPAVIDLVRSENALLSALIAESKPAALNGNDLMLAFAPSAAFLKKKAEDPANRSIVGAALQQLTNMRLQLSYELREEGTEKQATEQPATNDQDLVDRLMAEFDAVELPGDWLAQKKGD
jgi:hypothetical protein